MPIKKDITQIHATTSHLDLFVDTRDKVKILASLERMTMQEWLAWMVSKAYEAKLINNKLAARKPAAKKVRV